MGRRKRLPHKGDILGLATSKSHSRIDFQGWQAETPAPLGRADEAVGFGEVQFPVPTKLSHGRGVLTKKK